MMKAVCPFLYSTLLLFALGCGEPQKYPIGKDTVDTFGDGTWWMGKTGGGRDRKVHLFNHAEASSVVQNVTDWRRQGDWVYLLGEDGEYTVLNFRTNALNRYKRKEDAPEEQKPELSKLRPK